MENDDATPTEETTPRVLARVQRDLAQLRTDMGERFAKVDARFERVDAQFERVDDRFERVERRITESEIRLSTEISAVAGTLRDVYALLQARSRRRLPSDTPED